MWLKNLTLLFLDLSNTWSKLSGRKYFLKITLLFASTNKSIYCLTTGRNAVIWKNYLLKSITSIQIYFSFSVLKKIVCFNCTDWTKAYLQDGVLGKACIRSYFFAKHDLSLLLINVFNSILNCYPSESASTIKRLF